MKLIRVPITPNDAHVHGPSRSIYAGLDCGTGATVSARLDDSGTGAGVRPGRAGRAAD